MVRRAPGVLVLLVALVVVLVPAGEAPAAPKKPTKTRCPAGTAPVVKAKGRKVVAVRDRRGRLKCRAAKVSRPPAPSTTQVGQAAQVTSALRDAAAIDPRAFARLQRAVGKRRAGRLLDVTLEGWQRSVGARPRGVRARAAASTTWEGNDGVKGSASFDVTPVQGADSGFLATASAELTATRAGVEKLDPSLKEKLPPNVTSATGRVDVSFADSGQTCPVEGRQQGKVKASGKVTVKVERSDGPPVELELAADVEVGYTAKTDAEGKWTGIDDVDSQSVFRSSATGESTKVFRARRLATGLGTDAIVDSRNWSAAMERDGGKFITDKGGVFGPQSSWNWERGAGLSDIRSIDNLKAMYATSVASALLTYAAIDYLRKVARDRAEQGECRLEVFLKVDGRVETVEYTGRGRVDLSFMLQPAGPAPGAAPDGRHWTGTAPVEWKDMTFAPKGDCTAHSPVSDGAIAVTVQLVPSGALLVDWSTVNGARATVSVTCPGDPPTTASGLPGPFLLGALPTTFELPFGGGSQAITGGVDANPDGTFNDGTLTVARRR